MGLRSRIKGRVSRLLGRAPAPAPPAPPAPAPARAAPPPPPAPPPPLAPAPAPAPAPAVEGDEAERRKAEKAAAHFEKTRRAVLKKLAEEGGEADLGTLHDFSERRYFIGHKRFSDLMEGLVAEGLLAWDPSTGVATLTEAGRAYSAG